MYKDTGRAWHGSLGVIPKMDLDVILYTSFLSPLPRVWLRTKSWDVILLRRLDSDEFWTMLNQLSKQLIFSAIISEKYWFSSEHN